MEYKICSKCNIPKLYTEYHKCAGNKDGYKNYCKKCKSESNFKLRELYRVDTTKVEALKQYNAEYMKVNKENKRALSRDWYKKNTDKCAKMARSWQTSNRDKVRINTAKRRAAKLRATPTWAHSEWDQFVINNLYELAVIREQHTNFKWHVDHIVPLQSELVCGLHCANNLQVISATDNTSKRNFWWPDMWLESDYKIKENNGS